MNGPLDTIEGNLERVKDFNKKDDNQETPMALALKNNHHSIVNLLISRVEDVNPEYESKYTLQIF